MAFKREVLSYDGTTGKAIVQIPTSGKIEAAILFEHGIGERYKDDNGNIIPIEKNETLALPMYVKNQPAKVPNFLYVFPQCNVGSWSESVSLKVLALFDQLCKLHNIEERHCTGLSLGGYGTFWMPKWAYKFNGNKPGYFKSYGVVCGRGDKNSPKEVFEGSRWKVWHGTEDETVHTYQYGINLFGELAAKGVKEKEFHAYPGGKHAIWNQVYNPDPANVDGYFAWLRGQQGVSSAELQKVTAERDEALAALATANGKLHAIGNGAKAVLSLATTV